MVKNSSIIAFDYGSLPMHLYWQGKQFTHVACDWKEIGHQAMNILADLIHGESDIPRVMPVQFVEGKSVYRRMAGDKI